MFRNSYNFENELNVNDVLIFSYVILSTTLVKKYYNL